MAPFDKRSRLAVLAKNRDIVAFFALPRDVRMDFCLGVLAQLPVADDFEGTGFLPGSRGSFMLDFVFTAMFGILIALAYSIYLVKWRRQYELHKQLQVVLGLVLLVAVIAFEVDLQLFTDWEQLAAPSRYYQEGTWDAVWISLVIHLCFAIPTPFLWIVVIVQAFRKFPAPAAPGKHSQSHCFWGWIAAGALALTSVTGWVFYVLAFVM